MLSVIKILHITLGIRNGAWGGGGIYFGPAHGEEKVLIEYEHFLFTHKPHLFDQE